MRVSQRTNRSHLAAAGILLLAACAQTPYVPSETAEAPDLPVATYGSAAQSGDAVYRLDPDASRIFLRVGRDGPMKEMGHDHVIASEHVEGIVLVAQDADRSRADLRIPLQRLVVDKPAYRSRFGLDPEVSAEAISGTTRNMHEAVLESGSFPWAEVTARFASALEEPPQLAVSVTLHGVTAEYLVPVDIEADESRLQVLGEMTLTHGDFGLQPFSAAGGLLRVAETIGVVFELSGYTIQPSELAGP